jgi:hypothetical protein
VKNLPGGIVAALILALVIWGLIAWLWPDPYPPPRFDDGHLALVKIHHRFANRAGVSDSDAEKAVDYLIKHDSDEDPENRYRRRQAAVAIARYARFSTATAAGIESQFSRDSIVRLIGPDKANAIAQRAFDAFQGAAPVELKQQQTQAELATDEVNGMQPAVAMTNGCTPLPFTTQSTLDSDSQVITISKTFDINRPMSEVVKTFEPQRWAACNSKFFKQSYIAKKDPNGVPVRPSYDKCVVQLDPDTTDEPKDGTYNDILYEHFDAALGVPVYFQNLLLVDTSSSSASGYRVRFALYDSMCSRILGETTYQTGGIDVDWGEIKVAPISTGSWVTQVDLMKHFRLGPRGNMSPEDLAELRAWSNSMLEAGIDEAGFQACCTVSD